MIMANTGQETVRNALKQIQELGKLWTSAQVQVQVQILLRSPHLADLRRAENTGKTIQRIQEFNEENRHNGLPTAECRLYAGTSPLRSLLVEHKSGVYSGFVSFYDWRAPTGQSASTRDRAAEHARIITKTQNNGLLNASISWFSHLWGPHVLRAIILDFDDTLFSTTEPQVSGWVGAIQALLDRQLLTPDHLAPQLCKALGDRDATRDFVRKAFFLHQSETEIAAALIADQGRRTDVFDSLRKARIPIREAETFQHAQPAPNLSPAELKRLSKEYALVIVSATDDRLIENVLKKWDLRDLFPYILGRQAPRHDWLDLETKSQNLMRASSLLGVPLSRMVFIGDSDADYRSARQLGMKFIENRFNVDLYKRESLIRGPNPSVAGILRQDSPEGELSRLLADVEATLSKT
jgi:phosphoglycolate phosphatase-like HAD superfamily hydrolase